MTNENAQTAYLDTMQKHNTPSEHTEMGDLKGPDKKTSSPARRDTKKFLTWFAPALKILSSVVVIIVLAVVEKETSFYRYSIAAGCALFPFALIIVRKIFKTEMPIGVDYIFLIFVIMAADIGSALDYFTKVSWYDLVLHGLSGFVGPVIMLYFWRKYIGSCPKASGAFCLFLIAMGFAAIWECWEFIADLLVHEGAQRGLTDTMTDILITAVGAVVFVATYLIDRKKGGKLYRLKPDEGKANL